MTINRSAVGATSPEVTAAWTSTDCLLYALAVGAGADDPVDRAELRFTTENTAGVEQSVLPTFPLAVQLGDSPLRSVGDFDWRMIVNAEQGLTVHRALPVEGSARGRMRVAALFDKGSGTLAVVEGEAVDSSTGGPLWTARTGIFIRGEGGWGGPRGTTSTADVPADRPPDHVVTYPTRRDQALLYRLTGDRTPLHSDPAMAARAGFPRPILHGRCTLGFAGRALLHTLCGSDPARFRSIHGRFTKPVLPGEALTVSMWVVDAGEAAFRVSTPSGTIVVDAGHCTFTPAGDAQR